MLDWGKSGSHGGPWLPQRIDDIIWTLVEKEKWQEIDDKVKYIKREQLGRKSVGDGQVRLNLYQWLWKKKRSLHFRAGRAMMII